MHANIHGMVDFQFVRQKLKLV